jgi:hypothetical protein
VAAGSRLEYQAFDWQRSEVRLLVNWQDLGRLPEGPAGEWSEVRTVELPAAALNATGRNIIGFVARGSYPLWTTWGVREVRLVGPVIASPVARCYRPHEWAGEHPLSATLLSEGGQA